MPEQMKSQMEPVYIPLRKIHLYHCDHRGLPLIKPDGSMAWRAEYDEWGDVQREDNPDHLAQLIRLPGQQYDAETGLYYNRHRYYDPWLGRYITQDPVGFTSIIIGNGPVPDNPFGHAALATTRDGVISFGTGDSIGTTSLDSYFNKMQPRRDSWIWIVDTTSEEEKCMFNKEKEMDKNQGLFFDNCYSRTNAIFEACGFTNPQMNTNSPISLQVLGELYGSHNIKIPKGNFLGLPPELNVFSGSEK